jgi:hypothetical protein
MAEEGEGTATALTEATKPKIMSVTLDDVEKNWGLLLKADKSKEGYATLVDNYLAVRGAYFCALCKAGADALKAFETAEAAAGGRSKMDTEVKRRLKADITKEETIRVKFDHKFPAASGLLRLTA